MIRHLKFIFIWTSLIPQLTDGGSVTWYEPAPVRTTSNPADVLPVFIVPVYEGKPATLNWSYSLTLGLDVGGIRFKNVRLVKINSDGSAGPVGDNFPRRLSVSSTIGTVSLSISAVTVADDKANGEFSCELVDSNLDTWKRAIQVQVLVPTNISGFNGSTTVLEGNNLQLTCVAVGRPEPNITWTKEETGNQGNTDVLSKGKVLTITKISRNDSGTFSCTAYNGFGKAESQTVYVKVTYPAKILTSKFQAEYIVGLNQSVTLNCTAEGKPLPTHAWTPCGSGQVCDKSTLDLLNVCNDVNYTCEVANIHGNDSKTANVYIGGDVINTTIILKTKSCKDGLNKSSVEEAFKKELKNVFADKYGYEGVQSISVGCEIKTVDLALKFNSTTKEKNVITTLMNATIKQGNKLGEFSVSGIKRKTCPPNVPVTSPPPTDSSSEGMDWWEILLIALGVAFVFGLVVGICCWKFGPCCPCWTKNKGSREVQSNGDQDVEMKASYSSADIQYAAAGPNASYRASKPSSLPPVTYEFANMRSEGRRGNGASEPKEPLPQYAVVDKTKKKKKTPKPGELQYAELGELTGPRQKAVLPRVSGTDTVYSDIRT